MFESTFQPVSRPTLHEAVTEQIRAAIFTGGLAPGERLVESSLAKRLQVAQSTIREAMLDLVGEGLVVRVANRETRVRSLDGSSLRALLTVRRHLEPLAVELVVGRVDTEGLEELNSHVVTMRRSARDKEYRRFYKADIDFHSTLWRLSDNEFLVQSMKPLSIAPIAFVLAGLRTVQEVRYAEPVEEHDAIVEVIRKGDAKAAAALMRANIESWHAFQLSEASDLR